MQIKLLKYMKQSKFKVIISIVIFILFIIILASLCIIRKANDNLNVAPSQTIKTIDLRNHNIKDRYILIKNNIIYIGKNEKEVQNEFYDVKILYNSGKIYINKLFKKDISSKLIDYNYLNEVLMYIKYIFQLENIEDIKKQITDTYLTLRNNVNIEYKNKNVVDNMVYIEVIK